MAGLHPTNRPGLLHVPAAATKLEVRFAALSERDKYDPKQWRREPFIRLASFVGWWEFDIDALALPDGAYEYEFLINGDASQVAPDPYADELTRFGGYRGVFRIAGGRRIVQPFRWDDELPSGTRLPQNNRIVIYEMPLRWMSTPRETSRQVDLGTFDKIIFERLNNLKALGINCIELLPIQDSPDTLNWGYGTRFFFAPDIDMGTPIDAKFFIKRCHQLGIRVILDVVMNHSDGECPLPTLDRESYYITAAHPEPGRATQWSAFVFRFRDPDNGYYAAREFHCEMSEYWVREYHIDGFRLDEFAGINNWDFLQQFRDRAWAEHNRVFPDHPFYVVGEDSDRRFLATRDAPTNPNGRKVVDGIWNFSFRDEIRSLLTNQIHTDWGQPARSDRIRAMFRGWPMWDGFAGGSMREGYGDLSQAVNYMTSHDVKDQPRMMNFIFGALISLRGLGDGSVDNLRNILANLPQQGPVRDAHDEALDRIRSAFALLLTSVGIPMFLAGEEFADVHDLQYSDDSLKMSDPVDWERRAIPGHNARRSPSTQ
jgi:1,4-alpha-glucan branching enzyme